MSDRPLAPLTEAAIEFGVIPILNKVEKDLGRNLVTDVVVVMDGIEGPRILVGGEGESDPAPDGELRLKIRRAFGKNRYLYSIESVFSRGLSDTGFSGFTADGEIKVSDDGGSIVTPKAMTVRYHVWEFWDA